MYIHLKIAIIGIMLSLTISSFGQTSPSGVFRVQNSTTQFGRPLPIGTLVLDVQTNELYATTAFCSPTDNLLSPNVEKVSGAGGGGGIDITGPGRQPQTLVRDPVSGDLYYDTLIINEGVDPIFPLTNVLRIPTQLNNKTVSLAIGFDINSWEDRMPITVPLAVRSIGGDNGTALRLVQSSIDFDFNPGPANKHIWMTCNNTGWLETRGPGATPHGFAFGGDNLMGSFYSPNGSYGNNTIHCGAGNAYFVDGWLWYTYGYNNGRAGFNVDSIWGNRVGLFGAKNIYDPYNNGAGDGKVNIEDVWAFGYGNGAVLTGDNYRLLMLGSNLLNINDTSYIKNGLKDLTLIGQIKSDYRGYSLNAPNTLVLMGDSDSAYTYMKYNGQRLIVNNDSVWTPFRLHMNAAPGMGVSRNYWGWKYPELNNDGYGLALGYEKYNDFPSTDTVPLAVKYGMRVDSGNIIVMEGAIDIKRTAALDDNVLLKQDGHTILKFFGNQFNNTGFYLGTNNMENSFQTSIPVGCLMVGSENTYKVEGSNVYIFGSGNLKSNGIPQTLEVHSVSIYGVDNLGVTKPSVSLDSKVDLSNIQVYGSHNLSYPPDSASHLSIYGEGIFTETDSIIAQNWKGLKNTTFLGYPYRQNADDDLSQSKGWMMIQASPDSSMAFVDARVDAFKLNGELMFTGNTAEEDVVGFSNEIEFYQPVTVMDTIYFLDAVNHNGLWEMKGVFQNLADDDTLVLPANVKGWGTIMAGDNLEFAQFRFSSDGTVSPLFNNTPHTSNTDTDGDLCIIDLGTQVGIKNRTGSAVDIEYEIYFK